MTEEILHQAPTKAVSSPIEPQPSLPAHWEVKKLGEVCERISNGANVKQFDEEVGFPISRIETIWNQKVDTSRVKYILENETDFISKYQLKENDILFSHINSDIHLGKTAVYRNNPKVLIHGVNLLLLRCNSLIEPSYFNYYLNFLRARGRFISIAQKSVNQSSINQAKLKSIDIILPPLPEQRAIVSKIEELFSELDKSKQQLLTAQQQLKVYRQSLLKWAFEGKLTNKEVKEGELPKGWKWVKSGELFSFVTSGSRGWAKYYSTKGAIFIRITNLNFDTLELDLREEKIQYVSPPSTSEGIRTKVQEGDFLFSITGYLGMFAIAPNLENAFVNQHVCLCRPKDGFNKKYVGYWIISKSGGIHHLNKNQKGAVKAGLNLDDLKTFPVPICSLEEQQLIVSELESKLTLCDKIEETISQSLQQTETLRQSILKKAFEGKLVTNPAQQDVANTEADIHLMMALMTLALEEELKLNYGEVVLQKTAFLVRLLYRPFAAQHQFINSNFGTYSFELKEELKTNPYLLKKRIKGKEVFALSESLLPQLEQSRASVALSPFMEALYEVLHLYKSPFINKESEKIELFNTVTKAIIDTHSLQLRDIRKAMKNWKTPKAEFETKAEKFNEPETETCLAFIIEKGWDKKLMK